MPPYLSYAPVPPVFEYGAITLYGRTFQTVLLTDNHMHRLFRVRSPLLLGISVDFFSSGYLDVSVRWFALPPYVFQWEDALRAEFPHSDIFGIKAFCQLPEAFRRLTSFIAYHRQGIHQMHLFT